MEVKVSEPQGCPPRSEPNAPGAPRHPRRGFSDADNRIQSNLLSDAIKKQLSNTHKLEHSDLVCDTICAASKRPLLLSFVGRKKVTKESPAQAPLGLSVGFSFYLLQGCGRSIVDHPRPRHILCRCLTDFLFRWAYGECLFAKPSMSPKNLSGVIRYPGLSHRNEYIQNVIIPVYQYCYQVLIL